MNTEAKSYAKAIASVFAVVGLAFLALYLIIWATSPPGPSECRAMLNEARAIQGCALETQNCTLTVDDIHRKLKLDDRLAKYCPGTINEKSPASGSEVPPGLRYGYWAGG